jgi:hypothetical protein
VKGCSTSKHEKPKYEPDEPGVDSQNSCVEACSTVKESGHAAETALPIHALIAVQSGWGHLDRTRLATGRSAMVATGLLIRKTGSLRIVLGSRATREPIRYRGGHLAVSDGEK